MFDLLLRAVASHCVSCCVAVYVEWIFNDSVYGGVPSVINETMPNGDDALVAHALEPVLLRVELAHDITGGKIYGWFGMVVEASQCQSYYTVCCLWCVCCQMT